jgi:hypothetical protein
MDKQTPGASGKAQKSNLEGPAAYAPHKEDEKVLSPAAPGDERTPDKTIGEVKYAEKNAAGKDKEGGAGHPQASKLEPEKQGGIGGP